MDDRHWITFDRSLAALEDYARTILDDESRVIFFLSFFFSLTRRKYSG